MSNETKMNYHRGMQQFYFGLAKFFYKLERLYENKPELDAQFWKAADSFRWAIGKSNAHDAKFRACMREVYACKH